MGQVEMVTDIIAESAYQQISRLREDMKAAIIDITSFSKAGREAFSNLGNTSNLKDLFSNVKAATDATKGAIIANAQYSTSMEKAAEIIAVFNKEGKSYASILRSIEQADKIAAQAATERAKATELSAKASTEDAKSKMMAARAATENARQIESETRNTILLTKEKERLEKIAQREQVALDRQKEAYSQLSKEYNTAAREAQNLAAKKILLEREVSAGNNVQVNNTELARLGPVLAAAQENALKLHTSLLSIDQAVGKSQRNVGNYNGAVMAMSQLLREAPSFAYSFSTGMMGISNNIPILVEEITRLKAANESLKASGQATIPIWKTLMQAFTSPIGLITIATAAITIFTARNAMAANTVDKTSDSLKRYADALKSVDENTGASAAKELASTQGLLQIAQNVSLAMDIRVRAVTQLQEKYPDYLGNLSKEAILAGQTADEMERLNKALVAKATMEAGIEKIGMVEKKIIDFKKQLIDIDIEYARQAKEIGVQGKGLGVDPLEATYNSMKQRKDKINVLIAEAVKERDAFTKIVNEEAVAAGGLLLKDPDKKKAKDPKDHTLQNENDLTKALYDEYAKRLLLAAEYQKAIYTNDTKSMEERLMAFRQYSELTFEAESEGLSAQFDEVSNNLKAIDKIEKISVDKRTQQQKDLLAKKEVFLQQYNNISADYDLKEKQHIEATAKGIVAIQQEEVQKRIDSIKELTANVDIQEAQALKILSDKLLAGTITYKKYTLEKKQTEDKFQKEKYAQLVEYLQLEIAALSSQGVDTRKLQEQLNAAMKHLYDADVQNKIKSEKDKEEGRAAVNKATWDAANESTNTAKSLIDSYYEKQINYEQQLIDQIEARKQVQIDAINNSMQSEDKKQKQIQALNAQTAAQEKQLQSEMRRLKREQAIADRAATILGIVSHTAEGIARALKDYKWPYNLIVGAIIGGVGAAQAAAVVAQPLPQYAEGTPEEGHPGGPALVGEAGRELVQEPGKQPYFVDKPLIKDFAKGTRVIPEAELLANSMAFLTPSLMQSLNINNDFSRLEDATNKGFAALQETIANKRETHFHWSNGQLVKSVKNGSSWTTYLNNNF